MYVFTPNLRRESSDNSTQREATMRCGKPLIVGTYNALTLRDDSKREELSHILPEKEDKTEAGDDVLSKPSLIFSIFLNEKISNIKGIFRIRNIGQWT